MTKRSVPAVAAGLALLGFVLLAFGVSARPPEVKASADTRRATVDDSATELAEAVVSTRQSAGRRWSVALLGLAVLAGGVTMALRPR